jgi:hypothetical protein
MPCVKKISSLFVSDCICESRPQPLLGTGITIDEIFHVHPATDTCPAQPHGLTAFVDNISFFYSQKIPRALPPLHQEISSTEAHPLGRDPDPCKF